VKVRNWRDHCIAGHLTKIGELSDEIPAFDQDEESDIVLDACWEIQEGLEKILRFVEYRREWLAAPALASLAIARFLRWAGGGR
jgi:hypothetical protein